MIDVAIDLNLQNKGPSDGLSTGTNATGIDSTRSLRRLVLYVRVRACTCPTLKKNINHGEFLPYSQSAQTK